MQCEHVQRDLIAYQSGSLSSQECADLEAHLSTCEACTKEATAMKEMGDLLSRGLKEWVDHGVCPPDVAQRIEMSLRTVHQKPKWQRWATFAGVAAVAAAVFVVVAVTQPTLAKQMASVPLIGVLAAQLSDPDIEIHINPQTTAALFRPTRTVDLAAKVEAEGAQLSVERVATDGKLMRLQYTITGQGLVLPTDESLVVPSLTASGKPVALQSLTADRKGSTIHFVAYFEAVAEGERLTLTVPPLKAEDGQEKGAWTATFTN